MLDKDATPRRVQQEFRTVFLKAPWSLPFSKLLVVILLFVQLRKGFQQASQCSGAAGQPEPLTASTSPQDLSSPYYKLWNAQGIPLPLASSAGLRVSLRCIDARNVSLVAPSAASVFLQPVALELRNATGLALNSVTLVTECATVQEYQGHLCSTLRVAGSLHMRAGLIQISSWNDGFTTASNVTVTCPSAATATAPPCSLVGVRTAQQLLEAFTVFGPSLGPLDPDMVVVVAADINTSNSSWPSDPVSVSRNTTLAGSSMLYRPILDFQLRVSLWDISPAVNVVLRDVTAVNLAPTYVSPTLEFHTFSLLSERVWAFRRLSRQLHVMNCTIVVPPDELSYTKYWVTYITSPVPEARAKASWLQVVNMKVLTVNDSGIFYASVQSFTTTYADVRLTDTLGASYPLLPQTSVLSQLEEEGVPLTAVVSVVNASDFVHALKANVTTPDAQGRRFFLIDGNFSLGEVDIAVAEVPGSTVVISASGSSSGAQARQLGFGWRAGVLYVPSSAGMFLRQMTLAELPTNATKYDRKDPLAALASPLWSVTLTQSTAGAASMTLRNCTVLLSRDEVQLLRDVLLGTEGSPRRYDSALVAALAAFFRGGDSVLKATATDGGGLMVTSGATSRYSMNNVLFAPLVAAEGGQLPADFSALGIPYGPPQVDSGLAGWKIGVIVGCVVGGVALAVLLAAIAMLRRCRSHESTADSTDTMRQSAYDKYLAASAQALGRHGNHHSHGGAGNSDLPGSNELTTSSQVLRPGARASDIENYHSGGSAPASASVSAGMGGSGVLPSRVSSQNTGNMALAAAAGSIASAPGPGGSSGVRVVLGAEAAGGAAAQGPMGTEGGTDSFDQPPTASVLGPHGLMRGGASCQSVPRSVDTTLGAPGAALPAVPSSVGQPTSTTALSSVASGASAASQPTANTGGTALDAMHAVIQTLGRDFNDRQLAVHSVLGKGAHGTVYKGTWRNLPVAVKSMIFSSDQNARHQHRPLMEAAISSNLAHPNIVTTYSYELREVEHELASLSPELARQGGGWRLLIIQEYCDAGPLRRLVDCGFFMTPPRLPPPPPRSLAPLSKAKRGPAATAAMLRLRDPSPRRGSDSAALAVTAPGAPSPPSSASSSQSSGTNAAGTGTATSTALGAGGSVTGSATLASRRSSVVSPPPPPSSSVQEASSSSAGMQGQQQRPHGPGNAGASLPVLGMGSPSRRPPVDDAPDLPPRPASSLEAALRYVEAGLMMARGLRHIHAKNIVHGDLNPNNVLLVRTPGTLLGYTLKVADFGLSVRMQENESHLSNLFQGSPYYVAPEVVLSGKIGKSADIYSLGIMLWELQHGVRPPWRQGVRLRTYPSLNTAELEFAPDCPPRFARLVRDCFHGSKDARPGIGAVEDLLVSIKAELEALARA